MTPPPPVRTYVLVWLALIALLAATRGAAALPLGRWNPLVAFGIAAAKGALVVLFFMHVRHATPRVRTFAAGGFLWLVVLYGLAAGDYLSRRP